MAEFNAGTVRGDIVLGTKEFEKGIKKITLGLGAITGAFALVGKKAISTASQFETGMKEISTMLDKTGKAKLPEFSKSIKQMMMEFGEPAEKLQRGLYDILSAGIDASKAINVLTASTKMAKAGLTDTAVATDAITTILNSYTLSADKATDVSDLLFSIVKKGKTTMGELASVVGRVASLGASAGLSLDEMGASLASMTASGLKTEEAVTALRGILTTFLSPTEEAVKVAQKLGFELNSNTLKTLGLVGVMDKLKGATKEEIATIFGNVRALAGMSAMLQNTSKYKENLNAMTKRAGATEKAYKEIMNSTKVAFDRFKESVNALWIDLGEKLMPEVRDLIEGGTELANKILNMDDSVKQVIVSFGKMIFSLTGIGTIIGTGALAVSKLKTAFSGLNKVLAMSPLIATVSAIALLGNVALDVADKIISKNLAVASSYAEAQKQARTSLEKRIELLKKERDEIFKNLEAGKIKGDEALKSAERINKINEAINFYEKQLVEQRLELAKEEANKKIEENKRKAEQIVADDMEQYARQLEAFHTYQEEMRTAMEDQAIELETMRQEDMINELQAWAITNLEKIQSVDAMVRQANALMDNYYNLQSTKLKKAEKKELDTARKEYEAKKKWINENIKDEEERTKRLEELEEGFEATRHNIAEKYEKKEREMKARMKAIKIAETISNTAVAIMKAYSQAGIFAVPMATMIATTGALQVATIQAQPYEKGGYVNERQLALVGEKGAELVELPAGARVYPADETKEMIGQTINVNIQVLDPDALNESQWERIAEKVRTALSFEEGR